MFGKRRLRGSSVLRDIETTGGPDQPNIYNPDSVLPLPGDTNSSQVLPGALYGQHYAEVRNVIQIPFDDSMDSSFPLECFFQMPAGTTKINSAKVWVQQKPFRMYSSAASSAGAGGAHVHNIATSLGLSFPESAHTHGMGITGTQSSTHTHVTQPPDAGGTTAAEPQNHTHTNSGTGSGSSHQHQYVQSPGSTDYDIPTHSHTVSTNLTPGIFESGPSGTFSLFLSDTGNSGAYGAAIVSGSNALSGQSITGLTKNSGDKRIKFTATGLQRLQILVVLDLLIQVVLP